MANPETSLQDRVFLPIHVQVFPGVEKSLMSRSGALHLYRLLQQYGWCLAADDYAARWTRFWPRLKPVERAMLIFTVRSHCEGEFGRRLVIAKLPVDFEPFESDYRAAQLTAEIEREFEDLLEAYFAKIAGNNHIRNWIETACPAEYTLIARAGGLQRVFGVSAWICPEAMRGRCADVLRANGLDERHTLRGAAAIEKALFGFYECYEAMQ